MQIVRSSIYIERKYGEKENSRKVVGEFFKDPESEKFMLLGG